MRRRQTYKSPVLNWHFIVLGIIPLLFENFMILREIGDGKFLSASELIQKVQRYSWASSDFAEASIGLFLAGLFVNFIISLSRFEGYRIVALGKQLLFLIVEFLILLIFDLALSSIITVVVVVIGCSVVIGSLLKKRTRDDAAWDLYYDVQANEDKLTPEQKRAIASQFMDAMLDDKKSETDTKDIDDIWFYNKPHD